MCDLLSLFIVAGRESSVADDLQLLTVYLWVFYILLKS